MKHERSALEKMSAELLLEARDLGLIDFAYYPEESTGLTVTRSLGSAADACLAEIEKRGLQIMDEFGLYLHLSIPEYDDDEAGSIRNGFAMLKAARNDKAVIIAAILCCQSEGGA